MRPTRRAQGFTLIEAIVALILLGLITAVYTHASVANTAQQTSLNVNEIAGKVLVLIGKEINQGNPAAEQPHLSASDIQALSDGSDRTLTNNTFSATVTAQATDPPSYRVAVQDDKGNGVQGVAVAPGGTP